MDDQKEKLVAQFMTPQRELNRFPCRLNCSNSDGLHMTFFTLFGNLTSITDLSPLIMVNIFEMFRYVSFIFCFTNSERMLSSSINSTCGIQKSMNSKHS